MPLRSDFTDATPQAGVHAQHHNDLALAARRLSEAYRGVYSAAQTYADGDLVKAGGILYVAVGVPNYAPGDPTPASGPTWQALAVAADNPAPTAFLDSFDRPDGASVGNGWIDAPGFQLVNNAVQLTSDPQSGPDGYGMLLRTASAPTAATQVAEVDIVSGQQFAALGLVVRHVSSNDFWYARYYGGNIALRHLVSGVRTEEASTAAAVSALPGRMKIVSNLQTGNVKLYWKGQVVIDFNGSTGGGSGVGIAVNASAGSGARFDNWRDAASE